jgi:hypothetical protein
MAEVSARFWLKEDEGLGSLTRENAVKLVSGLAWRGIAGYPLTDEQ